jgi:hypothetical protein
MVLHDHQANPHVHISVRAESRHGNRLNPRKADLQRWRETYSERLRGWGIEAEATRQATRGAVRNYAPIWRVKAGPEGRLETDRATKRSGTGFTRSQAFALQAWVGIIDGLSRSESAEDRALAAKVDRYVRTTPFAVDFMQTRDKAKEQQQTLQVERIDTRVRRGPEIER